MTKDDLKSKAMKLSWSDLRDLWDAIDENDKEGFREWEGKGNAFEYLIIRAFELSSKAVQVRNPNQHQQQAFNSFAASLHSLSILSN